VGQLGYIDRLDPVKGKVKPFAGNGREIQGLPAGPAASSAIGLVSGITWDAAGTCYFSSGSAGLVIRINPTTGALEPVAGKGTANLAGSGVDDALSFPMGLAFDKAGDLFIADDVYNQVKMVTAARLR